MYRKPIRLLACLFLLVVVGPALAQQAAVAANPPIRLVLVSKTPLLKWYEKRNDQLVCTGTLEPLDFVAIAEESDCYRVRWSGRQGWVKREDIVTPSNGLTYFKGRVERDPLDGYAQCMYAFELLFVQQPAQVQIAVDEAVRLLPNDSRPRQIRARLLMFKRDDKGALDDLNVAARLDPSNCQIYLMRAAVAGMFQRQYEEALLDLDKASRLSPNEEAIYLMRAVIGALKGDFIKAAMDVDLAIRAYPDSVDAHVHRAKLLSALNASEVYNLPEAIVSARRACELTKWEDTDHVRLLVQLYERAGNKEEALRCQERAERVERANAAQLPPLPAVKP